MPCIVYTAYHIFQRTRNGLERKVQPELPGTKLLKVTVLCPTKSRPIGSWSHTRNRTKAISGMCTVNVRVSSHTGLNPERNRKKQWRREKLSTPVFWPREFHGTFMDWPLYSPWGHKESMGSQRVGHDWATFTSLSLSTSCVPCQAPCTIQKSKLKSFS